MSWLQNGPISFRFPTVDYVTEQVIRMDHMLYDTGDFLLVKKTVDL